jgi:REP element-mobilizing transposase RayT
LTYREVSYGQDATHCSSRIPTSRDPAGKSSAKDIFLRRRLPLLHRTPAGYAQQADTEIWAYCLMPNHVHLVMVPDQEDGLRAALGEAHRHYTRHINFRQKWRGHLWQERFHSFLMDEDYLLATVRYVERNPVAARLCESAGQWPWSSTRAHLRAAIQLGHTLSNIFHLGASEGVLAKIE